MRMPKAAREHKHKQYRHSTNPNSLTDRTQDPVVAIGQAEPPLAALIHAAVDALNAYPRGLQRASRSLECKKHNIYRHVKWGTQLCFALMP